MHRDGKKEAETVSDLSATHGTNRDHWPLIDIVRTFTRPKRGKPNHLILDSFDHEYYLIFDFDEDPEEPKTIGTCDICLVPLMTADPVADTVCLVSCANKFGVMRMIAALGLDRFDERVKAAFYQSSNPLRANG